MTALKNKNFTNEEIQENVDRKIEEKVEAGNIAGMDVPYQMSQIRTKIEELRLSLSNTKLKQEEKTFIRDTLDHKISILKKLEKLNKDKLKKLGVHDEYDMSDIDDDQQNEGNTQPT